MAPYSSDSTPSAGQASIALLIVRIAAALPFLYHGSGILFGALGGPGPHGFAAFMHAPDIVGYLVGLAQFGGGLANPYRDSDQDRRAMHRHCDAGSHLPGSLAARFRRHPRRN